MNDERGRLDAQYADYLRDESRRTGWADAIDLPDNEDALRAVLAAAAAVGETLTVQGARTGISGGAVPAGGRIVNCSRMTRLGEIQRLPDGGGTITAEPGVTLAALREALPPDLWFTPDLTETSASLGGLASCNGSGARSYGYGPTRDHVLAARVVLADGDVLDLRRGRERAAGRRLDLVAEGGRRLAADLPSYRMPSVKNAAGYFAADGMDALDVFIGSDGTLGIFSSLELRLLPVPAAVWGLMAFLPDEASALAYVNDVRLPGRGARAGGARVAAVEFIDHNALELLRREKAGNPAFGELPNVPAAWHSSVYAEFHGPAEDAVEALAMQAAELLAARGAAEDATWLATDRREIERIKTFRHAVPEAVNLTIDRRRRDEPALTKLGTDLAVPDEALAGVMAMYHDDLAAGEFDYVIFGHIGDNHVHVNILPRDLEDHERGKALYRQWARRVVDMGGSVAAEHGIGKLKTELLAEMYGPEAIEEMRRLKRALDPDWRLNHGNLFPAA